MAACFPNVHTVAEEVWLSEVRLIQTGGAHGRLKDGTAVGIVRTGSTWKARYGATTWTDLPSYDEAYRTLGHALVGDGILLRRSA